MPRMQERFLLLAVWIIATVKIASAMTTREPDIWGKIVYGMLELQEGALTRFERYSYTAFGVPFYNHEWLSEITFAFLWLHMGALGLWLLRLVIIGGTLGILMRLVAGKTQGVYAVLLAFFFVFLDAARTFSFRSQLFSFFFFALTLLILDQVFLKKKWNLSVSLALVPLMAVWANYHGLFLAGLGVISWAAIYIFLFRRTESSPLFLFFTAVVPLLCFAATLINPFGLDLWTCLFQAVSTPRYERIAEWAPVYLFHDQRNLLGFYGMAVLMIVLMIRGWNQWNGYELGLLSILFLAAFFCNRNSIYFCLAAFLYLPVIMEARFPQLKEPRHFAPIYVALVLVFSLFYSVASHVNPGQRPHEIVVAAGEHPYNAYKFIQDNRLYGNTAVNFNWAQSFLFYFHESSKVAFDGRYREVYPLEVEEDYVHFHAFDSQGNRLLDCYPTQMILMPGDWPGRHHLTQSNEWLLAYKSIPVSHTEDDSLPENAILFIRKGVFPHFEDALQNGEIEISTPKVLFALGEPL